MPSNAAGAGVSRVEHGPILTSLDERLTDLERRTVSTTSERILFEKTFDFVGPLSALTSKLWRVSRTGRLWVARIQPEDPGSTDTTIKIYKNTTDLTPLNAGSTTITVPASSDDETSIYFDDLYIRNPDAPADGAAVELVGAGTGASGLLVTLCWI